MDGDDVDDDDDDDDVDVDDDDGQSKVDEKRAVIKEFEAECSPAAAVASSFPEGRHPLKPSPLSPHPPAGFVPSIN